MSRMERHKERREGNITVKSDDSQFDVNPIVKSDNKDEIKRQKKYQQLAIPKSIEILKKDQEKSNKLFDIEEAFTRLEKKCQVPDHDTQLEIIKELFSGQVSEYNGIDFEKDTKTQKILISEEDLEKLLIDREKKQRKILEKAKRKAKKKAKIEKQKKEKFNTRNNNKKNNNKNYSKKSDEITKKVLNQRILPLENDYVVEELEKKPKKSDWPLYVLVLILLVVLIVLIINFLS